MQEARTKSDRIVVDRGNGPGGGSPHKSAPHFATQGISGEGVDPYRLDGQVAVITGGGTGLGLSIAESIAERGGQIALVGRRAEVLKEAVEALGGDAAWYAMDVTAGETPGRLYEEVKERFGRPTILINNAGIHLKRSYADTDDASFRQVLDTHVHAGFSLAREFGGKMAEAGGGSILFIASMAALFGIPNVVAYSAAKSAQLGLVHALAVELSSQGVRVNAIAPGWIDTAMSRKALQGDPARLERVIGRTPMRRLGQDVEIGRVAAFLSSPAAGFVTGVTLPVDGGASIGF